MGHYASEMGYHHNEPPMEVQGYSHEEMLEEFFGKRPGAGGACPRCGASIEWDWLNASKLLLHIKWHKNLAAVAAHRTRPYPGLEM